MGATLCIRFWLWIVPSITEQRMTCLWRRKCPILPRFTTIISLPGLFVRTEESGPPAETIAWQNSSTEAVVALAFRSIGALLPSVQAQDYYNEIVNTILALWEVNI